MGTLDFGSAAFPGAGRWLEIAVRTNGSPAPHTILTPRQPVHPTPYAITAANLSGVLIIKRFGSAGSLSGGGSGAPGLANAAYFKVVTGGHGYWDSVGRGGYGGGPSPCSDVAEAGAQGYMLVRW